MGRLAGGFQAFKELNTCVESSSTSGNFDSVGWARHSSSDSDAASRLRLFPCTYPEDLRTEGRVLVQLRIFLCPVVELLVVAVGQQLRRRAFLGPARVQGDQTRSGAAQSVLRKKLGQLRFVDCICIDYHFFVDCIDYHFFIC